MKEEEEKKFEIIEREGKELLFFPEKEGKGNEFEIFCDSETELRYIKKEEEKYPLIEKQEEIDLKLKEKDFGFSHHIFLCKADFRKTTFTKEANFEETTFLELADFEGATFTKEASFEETTFSELANFRKTTFSELEYFRKTTFLEWANFRKTTFTKEANFEETTFLELADFEGATFTKEAYFGETTFAKGADFEGATFSELADFGGTTFTKEANFEGATFSKVAKLDLFHAEIEKLSYSSKEEDENKEEDEKKQTKGIASLEVGNFSNRETPLWLKRDALNKHDQIQALWFHKMELEKHLENAKGIDKCILKVEKCVSEFGTNPLFAFGWLLFFNVLIGIFYLLFSFSLLEVVALLAKGFSPSFWRAETHWMVLGHFFQFIGNSFFLYEIIKSLRKFSRRL